MTRASPPRPGDSSLDELAKNIALAQRLHCLVRDHPDFEVLHQPTLYIYSFRYVPNAVADRAGDPGIQEAVDELNEAIADAVQRSGFVFLMTTKICGRVALRLSIGSHRTLEDDVDRTFEAVAREGRRLAPEVLMAAFTDAQEKSC